MTDTTMDLAIRYGAAWAAHDPDAIVALHTDDTVFHMHGGGDPAEGRSAVREAIVAIFEQSPDLRFDRKTVYFGERLASLSEVAVLTDLSLSTAVR